MPMKMVCHHVCTHAAYIKENSYMSKGSLFVHHHALYLYVGLLWSNLDWNLGEGAPKGHIFIENARILMIKPRKCLYYCVQ